MQRSKHFHPSREPFREESFIQRDDRKISGPFSWLNPTRARFLPSKLPQTTSVDRLKSSPVKDEASASDVSFLWRSRDNRKGRHAIIIHPASDPSQAKYLTPKQTSKPRVVAQGILHMFTFFPYWDISWLVALIFTLGSVVWVINGFFVWLPVQDPSTEFKNEVLYGGGISAFIGAVVFFEIGSVLLMFEAVNEKNSGCFGWALEQLESKYTHSDTSPNIRLRPDTSSCSHHHRNKKNLFGLGAHQSSSPQATGDPDSPRSWQWFPSYLALREHYLHELGFLASFSQFLGATIFSLAGITALPGINNKLSQTALNVIYWLPQIIGGSGFIISSTLYMLETQEKWYIPAFHVLGWHIGFWNLIGAFGFTLSGALGPAYGNSGAQYEAGLATFWGSWAFLIGSVLQLYESLQKFPVEIDEQGAKEEKRVEDLS
ncbi:MAG: hypothetical protein Q9227_003527 [Pyrenula ochraceoflavens]